MAKQWAIGFRSSNGYTSITQDGHTMFTAPDDLAESVVRDHNAALAASQRPEQAGAELRAAVTDALPGLQALSDEDAALAAYEPGTRLATIIEQLRAALAQPAGSEGA